jgi:hypothetical protein
VKQPNGNTEYESPDYLLRRGQRQVQLLLDPPLVVCGDIKIEFSYKLKLDMVGIKPRFMQPKKEFHFWFNSFFVDSPWNSGEWKRRKRKIKNGGGEDAEEDAALTGEEYDDGDELLEEDSGVVSGRGNGVGENHETDAFHENNDEDQDSGCQDATAVVTGNGCNGVSMLRSYPPPMRHVSSEAAATISSLHCSQQESSAAAAAVVTVSETTNLLKMTSISDDHLLQGDKCSSTVVPSAAMQHHHHHGGHHHGHHHVAFNNPHHTVHATSSASSCSTSSNSSSSNYLTIGRYVHCGRFMANNVTRCQIW